PTSAAASERSSARTCSTSGPSRLSARRLPPLAAPARSTVYSSPACWRCSTPASRATCMTKSSGTTNSPGANCNGDSRPEGRGAGTAPNICNDTRASACRPPRSGGEAQDGPSTESSGTSTGPNPLQIEPATSLLAGVRQVLSPHFDARPKGVTPELIVVHGISLPAGEFGGPWIDHLFAGDLRADAHPSFRDTAGL